MTSKCYTQVKMKLRKFRWSKVYESSEEELIELLKARKITTDRWTTNEYEKLGKKTASEDITLWCAEGSFTLRVDHDTISMQPGDAVQIPKDSEYEIDGGMFGCICYQSSK